METTCNELWLGQSDSALFWFRNWTQVTIKSRSTRPAPLSAWFYRLRSLDEFDEENQSSRTSLQTP
jgi:hypothetical protein